MFKTSLIVSALFVAAVPAAAQDAAANSVQQKGQATQTQPQKPAEPKVCKRLSHGKVCMTAAKWKEYAEIS